jgi:hypothetical protein
MFLIKNLVVTIAVFLSLTSSALACACCVNRGYYELSRVKPDAFYVSILDSMNFEKPADIYLSEAGFDGTRGIEELAKEEVGGQPVSLSVSESFASRSWKFSISSSKGRKGTLVLPMPVMMTRYKADRHDTPAEREVVLYKEFIFNGQVGSATGIFQSANMKPTAYTLVFQGRGNGCDDASDFTNWRLELNGKNADYAFFGKLKR